MVVFCGVGASRRDCRMSGEVERALENVCGWHAQGEPVRAQGSGQEVAAVGQGF